MSRGARDCILPESMDHILVTTLVHFFMSVHAGSCILLEPLPTGRGVFVEGKEL
ncbi:hypothetical protein IscW_ISCW015048 [Ixodes scapularis]|uniref:Uncharacterized protein n=1 Tax=Ixodes scapularis TaxID=6945 RepID=B7QJP9_IXOSC|nr:hypothetical protein IscW_ISCW015048 [Ixodes scapularis]|eukprot:XP_002415406.1 hypothetical protein IscW_ISCW015048 [Ixodes scapularis]